VISVGSLLAAMYVFRVVALAYAQPRERPARARAGAPTGGRRPSRRHASRRPHPPRRRLLLAVLAIVLGLAAAPLVASSIGGLPPGDGAMTRRRGLRHALPLVVVLVSLLAGRGDRPARRRDSRAAHRAEPGGGRG
jgi:hypothetical protein